MTCSTTLALSLGASAFYDGLKLFGHVWATWHWRGLVLVHHMSILNQNVAFKIETRIPKYINKS